MNEETRKLQEMLERATAPGDQVPADLDAETSSLRDSWLTLGRLLDDAAAGDRRGCERWRIVARPAPHRGPLAWAAALAASLLLAAGLTHLYWGDERPVGAPAAPTLSAQGEQAATSAIATTIEAGGDEAAGNEARPALAAAAGEAAQHVASDAVADELAWDSSLDDQITAVAQATAWVRNDAYAQAVRFQVIEHGLDEIKRDIEDGTL